jgi:rare lipoprotein A
MDIGGRWCGQIGAFHTERLAIKLKSQLKNRYPAAAAIEFPGQETSGPSYWVRIRPFGDNRQQAKMIAKSLRPVEGNAFLTRLD